MIQNPFNQEENLSPWLERDAEFRKVKQDAFKKHVRTHDLNPNIFMSLKESYLKTINFITKNVILATVLLTLVVAGASVTAAEILLPRYKPSSLLQGWFENTIETPVSKDPKIQNFTNNTQTQKNPNELLLADDQNYVFVNHTCGVIVKYPKKFENSITKTTRLDSGNPQYLEIPPYDDFGSEISVYTVALDNSLGGATVSMKCSTEKPRVDPFEVKVSKEKLQEITGWFLSVAEIDEVTLIENTSIPFGYNYYFKYKDMYYSGSFVAKAAETKEQRNYEYLGGLYATQVQIQLKDQVPNPPVAPLSVGSVNQDYRVFDIQSNAISEDKAIDESMETPTLEKITSATPIALKSLENIATYPMGDDSCSNYSKGTYFGSIKEPSGVMLVVDTNSLKNQQYKVNIQGVASSLNKNQLVDKFTDLISSKTTNLEKQNIGFINSLFNSCEGDNLTVLNELDLTQYPNTDISRAFLTSKYEPWHSQRIDINLIAKKGDNIIKIETQIINQTCEDLGVTTEKKTELGCFGNNVSSEDVRLGNEMLKQLLQAYAIK